MTKKLSKHRSRTHYHQYGRGAQLFFVIFVALFGAVVIDTTAKVIADMLNLGSVLAGYESLGRYAIYFMRGEASFPEPDFSSFPKLQGEAIVGLGLHFFVCVMDTLCYFFLTFIVFKSKPNILVALVLMWVFLCMPLYIEMPALGMGWAAANSPMQQEILIRTFVCHSFFACALYLGSIIFDRLYGLFYEDGENDVS